MGRSRALGNTQPARVVHLHDTVQFIVCEAVHHDHEALDPLDALLLSPFGHELRHARDHLHDLAHWPHLLQVLELLVQVPQGELPLGDLAEELGLLVQGHRLGDGLEEALQVAHAQKPRDEGLRLEGLELIEVLPCAEEDDRRVCGGHSREGAPALGMAVKLSDDDAANIHAFPEGLGLLVAGLPDVRIHDENDVVGLHCLGDLLHLIEQRRFLLVPPRGVHDDEVVLLLLEELHALLRYLDGVCLVVVPVEGYADLGGVLPQLVKGTCPEGVRADQGRPPALPVVVVRVLRARCRLPAALQAHKHDDVARALFQLVRLSVR
mmetsp:Transcript_97233/g.299765  ORF Transcript_97233/g.299765 Transcript_97233/m.299765 type:complete len:322 (-) Transcript_97233:267-1232(-)